MRRARPVVALGVLAATSLMASLCAPDPGPDPCDLDPTACGPGEDWSVATCAGVDPGDPLEVEIGGGEETFEPLAAEAPPEVHFGLQGGQHTFVSFRVLNARLDLYSRLRITAWMAQGDACVVPAAPLGALPPGCSFELGRRVLVLGSARFPLEVDAGGAVMRAGIVMFLNAPPVSGTPAVVVMEIEDPCGRAGLAGFAWTP